eukprot:TRINITY_DN9770_c0_g1_i4.p1 TRINITY_DN9770_c0_g1~~TRINITY_DN9770_c0_g1_i4.p1  ORF type:complete len:313 (+),score=65.45 TRINITY_DN9770_c0_g1_i4:171-1109(+)
MCIRDRLGLDASAWNADNDEQNDPEDEENSCDEDSDETWLTMDSEEQQNLAGMEQNPESSSVLHPQLVRSHGKVLQVDCGLGFTMLLVERCSGGTSVRCLGALMEMADDEPGLERLQERVEFLEDKRVVEIRSGGYWMAAVCENGDCYTWGCREGGDSQGDYLGHGDSAVAGSEQPMLLQGVPKIRSVACGDIMMGAIDTDGKLWTWGDGDGSSLGHADSEHQHRPKRVEGLEGTPAKLAFSFGNSAMIDAEHNLYLWGIGDMYEWPGCVPGCPSQVPRRYMRLAEQKVIDVAVSHWSTLVVTEIKQVGNLQ